MPAALVFDYPEAAILADYLLERLAPEEDGPPGESGVDPALNELARLEATLARLDVADDESGAVMARLESLLTTWKATRNLAGLEDRRGAAGVRVRGSGS